MNLSCKKNIYCNYSPKIVRRLLTIKVTINNRLKIRLDQLIDALFFLYLCLPLSTAVFEVLLSVVDISSYARVIAVLITYSPFILIVLLKKRDINIVVDFWIIVFFIAVFFAIRYLVHPEYEPWYSRKDYGVLNYVFFPDNGLYIYFFIRLVNDPKRILKCIKLSAWPMYIYYGLHVVLATFRGYWMDTSIYGYEIHMSYNLSLGYSVLIFVLVFLHSALEKRKVSDWIGAIIGISIILIGGSRGPFLDIAIFLVLYVLLKISNSRKKVLLITTIILLAIALWIFFPLIITFMVQILNKFNVSSRFLIKLLNGSIADDSGRGKIWAVAIEMIKKNPLGYGAMGSRHVIKDLIYVAHPHQIFLEILIDFGVIVGTVIIVWLVVSSIKIFMMKDLDEWKDVFLIFFARGCQLLVSLTFWHSIGLWGALAVGVCIHYSHERRSLNDGEQ